MNEEAVAAYTAGRWFGARYLADWQNADDNALSAAAMAILATPEERAEIAAAARKDIGVAADALIVVRVGGRGRRLFDMPRFVAGVKSGIADTGPATGVVAMSRQQEWRKRRWAAGLCVQCGQPARARRDGTPATKCASCYEKERERLARRLRAVFAPLPPEKMDTTGKSPAYIKALERVMKMVGMRNS